MNLQEMLGDAYHEGMTIDEINSALQNKKFADLSTGAYVDKNKYDADIKAANTKAQEAATQLKGKLSEDEQREAEKAADKARITELETLLKDSKVTNSKSKAESLISEARTLLDIKSDDAKFKDFIDSVSSEDLDKTTALVSYINKLVKDSYEKGKKDSTKNALGNFSKDVKSSESDGGKAVGSLGKEIAQANSNKAVDANLYFKRQ